MCAIKHDSYLLMSNIVVGYHHQYAHFESVLVCAILFEDGHHAKMRVQATISLGMGRVPFLGQVFLSLERAAHSSERLVINSAALRDYLSIFGTMER